MNKDQNIVDDIVNGVRDSFATIPAEIRYTVLVKLSEDLIEEDIPQAKSDLNEKLKELDDIFLKIYKKIQED